MIKSGNEKSPLRIIFMGSPDFAVPSLEGIIDSGQEILAVVSGTDKKRGRGGALSPTPVKEVALKAGLKVISSDNMKDPALATELKALAPDVIVIVAFKILPPEILEIPKIGAINLHASLLPKYRGAAPIHWAVINGEQQTGNTIFFLDKHVDTGNILMQQAIPIGKNETTGEVYQRLMKMGGELIVKALDQIQQGRYELQKQDDSKATPAPKIFPEDCLLHPEKSAHEVHNFIRGMSPFPGAWFWLDGKKFKIYRSQVCEEDVHINAGELDIYDKKLLLGCGSGVIELLEVQLHGRQKLSGTDFSNGYSGELKAVFEQ